VIPHNDRLWKDDTVTNTPRHQPDEAVDGISNRADDSGESVCTTHRGMSSVIASPTPRAARWARLMTQRRAAVIMTWVVLGVLGLLSASGLSSLLTSPLSVPGTDSAIANQILLRHFHQNIEGSFTVVADLGAANATEIAHDQALVRRAVRSVPTAQVTQQQAFFGTIFTGVNTAFDLSHAAAETDTLRTALKKEGLATAEVTGPPALQHDLTPILASDLHRGEVIAIILAIIILLLVLGWSWSALIPIAIAGATIAVDIGVVFLLAHRTSMVLYIPNVIQLIALGLAIDYSLLVVHRFRHEMMTEGVSVEHAVAATLSTAGRTVAFSSGIVAVGLAILFAMPVPFLRSLGAAGFFVPLVAMAAALTLLPALLSLVGARGVRAHRPRARSDGGERPDRWARLARAVVARPGRTLTVALIILAACSASSFWLQLTPGSTSAIPQNIESAHALTVLSSRFGPGVVSPSQIVIDLGRPRQASTPSAQATTMSLAKSILVDPEVFAVAIGHDTTYVDPSGRYEQIYVIGRSEFGAPASQQLVSRLRHHYIPRVDFGQNSRVVVGGAPAQGVDFLASVYDAFPWVLGAALLVALIWLARAFRSLVLAVVSVVLNLLSVSAAFGLLVLFTRFGVGTHLLGTYHVAQIEGWVPVFLFAVLFGLSMDYEVFLVSRMREAHDAGATTSEAIVTGVARTGRVVSAAAIILVGAVSGLIVGHVAGLQELGMGLALGILVDATIVRGLVLPSVMTLLGRWNWWLPSGVATLLRTTPSPLESPEARA